MLTKINSLIFSFSTSHSFPMGLQSKTVVPIAVCQQLAHHTRNRYQAPSSLHHPRAAQVAHQTTAQVTTHCAAPRAPRRRRPLRTETNRDLLCWTKSIFISYYCDLNPRETGTFFFSFTRS